MAFIGKGAEKLILLLKIGVSNGLPELCFMHIWVSKQTLPSRDILMNDLTLLYNPDCSIREVSVIPDGLTPDFD